MKMTFWILGILIVVAIIFVATRKGKDADATPDSVQISYGPFVVQADARTGKTYNMNFGRVRYTNVSYSIWYEGKPVKFPGALQNNTGLPFLWRVYALPDAPEPTLIGGSQSLYLVSLKNGEPEVKPIYAQGSDFASLQFLDSENGQPGPRQEVFAKNEAVDLDRLDTLQGGRCILVSDHAVLDVQTLNTWVFNPNNNAVDNYSFPQPKHAIAFSPDHKKIAFNAAFQSWNTDSSNLPDSEHAIVVYDYEKDSGYTVLYDDTDTRMKNMWDINIDWFNTYFEWNGDSLRLKKLDKLPNWTGLYKEDENYYYLYPVEEGMLPAFLDFVLNDMGWNKDNIISDETGEYTGRVIVIGSGTTKLSIVYDKDSQQISFSRYLYDADTPEIRTLVREISSDFDTELHEGKHQENFGRIISETKKILSY